MKNLLKATIIAAGIFSFTLAQAQTKKDTTFGQKVGKTATDVGDATAHTAVSGTAAVTDKVYKGKMGPDGQTIYINKYSHYFYIDKKGKRVYLKKSELKDKPKD